MICEDLVRSSGPFAGIALCVLMRGDVKKVVPHSQSEMFSRSVAASSHFQILLCAERNGVIGRVYIFRGKHFVRRPEGAFKLITNHSVVIIQASAVGFWTGSRLAACAALNEASANQRCSLLAPLTSKFPLFSSRRARLMGSPITTGSSSHSANFLETI